MLLTLYCTSWIFSPMWWGLFNWARHRGLQGQEAIRQEQEQEQEQEWRALTAQPCSFTRLWHWTGEGVHTVHWTAGQSSTVATAGRLGLVGTIGGSDWLVHWEEDGQENGSICQIASFFAAACSTKLLQLVTSHEWKLLQRNYSNISSETCSKVSFVPSCFFVLRRMRRDSFWPKMDQNGSLHIHARHATLAADIKVPRVSHLYRKSYRHSTESHVRSVVFMFDPRTLVGVL